MLTWLEIRRNKLRFSLLTSAIALIAFLMIFLTALSFGLITSITGAINGLNADLLVFSKDSQASLQISRIAPGQVEQVAAVPGVASAAPIATTTVSTESNLSSSGNSLQLFASPSNGAGAPTGLVAGELPTRAGEVAIDAQKIELGTTIQVVGGPQLTVVGLMKGAQFAGLPTGYTTFATYSDVFAAVTPGAGAAPVNAIAVTTAPGSSAETVSAAIQQDVTDVVVESKAGAAAAIPGATSITQTFGLLVGLCLISGVVVVGFFFLILTVAKLRSLTVLRAIGASTPALARALFGQITVVVVAGGLVGTVLAMGAIRGLSAAIPVSVSPMVALGCCGAILIGAYVTGAISVRRLARIEPAQALGGNP